MRMIMQHIISTTMASSEKQQPIAPCHVVAMPYPGRGHINPMLNLCTVVAERSSDILITVVVTDEWLGLIGSMKKPPNISLAAIPNVLPSEKVRGEDVYGFFMAAMTKMEEPFERLLDGGGVPPPDLIVADAGLVWAGEVAARRNIPLAYLWPMSASVFTVFYHFDLFIQNGHFPIDLSVNGDEVVDYIPGVPAIRLADLPPFLRDQTFLPFIQKIRPDQYKANFVIFTSFYELESQVFDHLKKKTPFSIYNIGPATSYFELRHIKDDEPAIATDDDGATNYLRWLDLQPSNSVLYVSLGSFIHICMAQMDEIAAGLQASGVRFLWVARRETSRLQDMCGDMGLVVEWCDQLRVLSHHSVGGFFSHCGWNSTKEALLAGVPMLTFPITMDQLPHAKMIVEDWRTGLRLLERDFDEGNLKKRCEIAEIVKRFMNLEGLERKELSRNARKLQNICGREFENGGSYQANLDGFVRSMFSCSTLKS